jgi:multicomponent Na+:H+ antiporter subunit A
LVSIAGFVAIRPFFGKSSHAQKKPHEAPWPMWIGPVVLSILGLVLSFFPNRIGTSLISPAAGAILGEPQKVKLALWHGITPMLILSGITIFLGVLLYVFQHPLRNAVVNMDFGHRFGPDRIYRLSLVALERYAQIQTRFLQNGSLPRYILTVLLAAIGLIGFTFLNSVSLEGILVWPEGIKFYGWVLPSIIIAATIAIVIARSRLAAVASLGVIGFSIAMLYILFGAPDLAMTQFAIETLTVILFVFVLYRLPRFSNYTGKATRLRDAFIAVSAGAMMTLLVLVITSTPLVSRLTPFFAQNSYTLAKGRNIVNVILVDFRGIDTLGEITVLAVAAIGVFALMKLRPNKEAELGYTPPPDSPHAQGNMLESTNNQDYLE